MAAGATLSLEDFLKLPEYEEDGTRYELDEGCLIALPPPGKQHGILMLRIGAYLEQVLDPPRFAVMCESFTTCLGISVNTERFFSR